MFDRELNVGDYIFQANGNLAKITGKGKSGYSYRFIHIVSDNPLDYTGRIALNGVCKHYYREIEEWFYCDEPTAKALEIAFKSYKHEEALIEWAKKTHDLLGKSKFYLEQIKDVKTIEVDER